MPVMMANGDAPPYAPAVIETISPEDFETASIRSAAPSYTSDAPSYHSTATNTEPIPPPYSPPERPSNASSNPTSNISGSPAPAPLISSDPSSAPRQGLPPVPSGPLRRPSDVPSLGSFRIPSWSSMSANPTARHYHSVALRRVRAASRDSGLEDIRRIVLDRIEEEERNFQNSLANLQGGGAGGAAAEFRVRPLEDPYLVGEAAAAQARRERLARENGDEILIREDRRWDFFLGELSARRPSPRVSRLAMR